MAFTVRLERQNRLSFLDLHIIMNIKYLPHLSTINLILVAIIQILTGFYLIAFYLTLYKQFYRCIQIYSNLTKLRTGEKVPKKLLISKFYKCMFQKISG